MWALALDAASPAELLDLGWAAYQADQRSIAETALRPGAESGDMTAVNRLGIVLVGTLPAEAEEWFHRNALGGSTADMFNLAGLLSTRGATAGAEEWLRRAIAMPDWGPGSWLEMTERWPNETEPVHRRAAERGDVDAMNNLGVLLKRRGQTAAAEHWYRRAAQAGHTDAQYHLGVLLAAHDDREAELWYRAAAAAGDTWATNNLATLLADRGNDSEAEQCYRRAAQAHLPQAMINVAALLTARQDSTEAAAWCRRAAEAVGRDAPNDRNHGPT